MFGLGFRVRGLGFRFRLTVEDFFHKLHCQLTGQQSARYGIAIGISDSRVMES